ncbi:uncharacterized protein EV422DRAFT_302474 [Fimicolochytrium jonesii]|uniref:uncharacterized protein n=1 Tax=Fimicolochytrium jonesii TaxID=1396493 RepID=UPI0022FF1757|nr:uncharacterized protein EV422DRAFT_302474 [Fimicolochytrium jonesii]KAI8823978.1 hypothetical protein EV422DRAFT_302474 [Fimicolochytrium jonesii]
MWHWILHSIRLPHGGKQWELGADFCFSAEVSEEMLIFFQKSCFQLGQNSTQPRKRGILLKQQSQNERPNRLDQFQMQIPAIYKLSPSKLVRASIAQGNTSAFFKIKGRAIIIEGTADAVADAKQALGREVERQFHGWAPHAKRLFFTLPSGIHDEDLSELKMETIACARGLTNLRADKKQELWASFGRLVHRGNDGPATIVSARKTRGWGTWFEAREYSEDEITRLMQCFENEEGFFRMYKDTRKSYAILVDLHGDLRVPQIRVACKDDMEPPRQDVRLSAKRIMGKHFCLDLIPSPVNPTATTMENTRWRTHHPPPQPTLQASAYTPPPKFPSPSPPPTF